MKRKILVFLPFICQRRMNEDFFHLIRQGGRGEKEKNLPKWKTCLINYFPATTITISPLGGFPV